jgi:polysaccharide deacetylase family sporulation protein PdaB
VIKRRILFIFLLISFLTSQEAVYAHKKSRAYWETRGDIIWEVNTNKKIIALTFDDGPDPQYTRQILDLFDKYKAKGTFFVMGRKAKSNFALIKEMEQKGHEIANHTYHHPQLRTITLLDLQREIRDTDDVIHAITGTYPALFRPPGGVYDDKVVEAAKTGNHLVVMWSWTQDTEDWKNPGVKKIVNKVYKNASPGNIVLFHDGGGNRIQTVKAVEIILDKLSKEGYQFVTVSQLLSYKEKKASTKK